MTASQTFMDDQAVIERILSHVRNGTTDLGDEVWREPVENYRSEERFRRELALLRAHPVPFCPSAALREPGAYVARIAAGIPVFAVRGEDGVVRAFRNACRHRGSEVASGAGCSSGSWKKGVLEHHSVHSLMPLPADKRQYTMWALKFKNALKQVGDSAPAVCYLVQC